MSEEVAKRRIQKEILELVSPPDGIIATPDESDLFHWTAVIAGPVGTPYEGGCFNLDIQISKEYPFKAPKVVFKTPVYHCNVSKKGGICLDTLNDKWTPILTITKLLLSIQLLLSECNPKSALEHDIARLYESDRKEFEKRAREHTRKHAIPK